LKNVSLVKLEPNRASFAQHRLHLNDSEKKVKISKILASTDSHDFAKKYEELFPVRLGREYEDSENTPAENNGPINSHLISAIWSNIWTVVTNSEIVSHKEEMSLIEPI